MNRTRIAAPLVLLALATGLAACGSSSGGGSGGGYGAPASQPASTTATGAATVKVARTGLGPILAAANGRTLYLFRKDRASSSACSGACAQAWPPVLTSGAPKAVAGAKAGVVGSIKRADGREQVTYAGHPLYTYAGDSAGGQTTGQGLSQFGAPWYVVSPGGTAVLAAGS
jgi:predicted lipoprotein with Yx(FWY)xxD motif